MSFSGSAFGSGFSSASPFGTVSSSAFGGGASAFGASQPSLFNSAPASSFGTSTNVFGTPTSLFGSSDPSFATSAPGFGASTSGFGAANPGFGASAPASGFGAQGFGAPGGFGASSSAFGVSSAGFGASTSAFGAAATGFGVSSSAFGGASTSAFGGGFGTGISASQPANEPISTRTVKWSPSQLNDSGTATSDAGRYVVISAMENFRNFSLEELRFADYQRGDTGGENPPSTFGSSVGAGSQQPFGGFGTQQQPPQQQQQQAFGGSVSLFGNSSQQSSSLFGSSLFGAQPSSSAFGASAPGFGASTPILGAPAPAFGSSTPAQGMSSSLFGASSAAFGTTTNSFGSFSSAAFGTSAPAFGATPAPGGGLFGASQPNTGFSAPGASSQALFGAPSQPALFATSAPAAGGLFSGGGSAFGASSAAPAGGFGTFGAQSAPSLFGNSASTPAFGTVAQSSSSLFGGGGGFGGGGASSSALFGASSSSLFGSSGYGGTLGSSSSSLFSNFGASSQNLFGGSTFGASQPWGANPSSAGLFSFYSGSGLFGQQNVNQAQQIQPSPTDGPLSANLTDNPFGDSKLITGAAAMVSQAPVSGNGMAANSSVIGQSTGALSVIVGKTTNALDMSLTKATRTDVPRQPALVGKADSNGWFVGSPMRPWGRGGSLFHVGAALTGDSGLARRNESRGLLTSGKRTNAIKGSNYYAPWRSEKQVIQAANIRKLVIEPLSEEELQRRERRRRDARERDKERKESRLVHLRNPSRDHERGEDTIENVDAAALVTPRLARESPKSRSNDNETIELENVADGHKSTWLGGKDQVERIPSEKAKQTNGIISEEESLDGVDLDQRPNENEVKNESGMRIERDAALNGGLHSNQTDILTQAVEYKDLYRRRMSAGRSGVIGNKPHRFEEPGGVTIDIENRTNTRLPKCTREGSYTVPSVEDMRDMTDDQLSHIESFTYGLTDIGELTWEEPVDVRGLDLDNLVRMRPREVCVYPDEKKLPQQGHGLNKRAIVRLHGVWKLDKLTKIPMKDTAATAFIVEKLKKHCEREGLGFLGYDVATGTWTFRAEHF